VPKPTRCPTKLRVFAALFLSSVLASTQAATLWVAPANLNARAALGLWAVTKSGRATFSFAVPDDAAEILSAKLVLLPSADAEIAYRVRLALTQEGLSGDDYTDVMAGNNVELVRHQVVEIDIYSVIPPVEMLVPGRDYLTVGFVARSTGDARIAEAANVLGLRLEYETRSESAILIDSTGEIIANITVAPNESLEITAALEPPFVNVAQRCQESIPVRLIVTDAETANILFSEQGLLNESSRLFTATLQPSVINGGKVQVGVLTARRFSGCVVIDISAVNDETGVIRRLVPD
jgi:hypothetical protein